MEILRDGYCNIRKKLIDVNSLEFYNEEKIKKAVPILESVIENTPISTFGLITLLRENYYGDILSAYNSLTNNYDSVKCNCYYLSKVLKKRLQDDLELNTYFLTHQAHFFALDSGDKIIKESHISLLYPSIYDGRIFYTIFDPGLKIDKPLQFYANSSMVPFKMGESCVSVGYNADDKEYPYYVNIDGINPYSYTTTPHNVRQKFNPMYQTENIDEMLYPISYKLLTGYKATIFSKDISRRAYITLNHLNKNLEFSNCIDNISFLYSYDEILLKGKVNLKKELEPVCTKLLLNCAEIVEDIFFMIYVSKDYDERIMDKNVINEFNNNFKKRIKIKK